MANPKRGIVLMNLGSPDSTAVKDVRKYLNEFLFDERVIDYSWLFRKLLVQGVIVPRRAPNSAEAYATIWTAAGSPLIENTRQLAARLQDAVSPPVVIAMRYGNPSMESAYETLLKQVPGLEEVTAVPLYPHYAMSSYETAVEHARSVYDKKGYRFSLRFVAPFFEDPGYLDAMAVHMRPYLQQDFDHLLFSFHGIPERHIKKSDPTRSHCLSGPDCCAVGSVAHATCYRHQCLTTMEKVAMRLGLSKDKYSFSFQSRLGRQPWLKPYTDFRFRDMPKEGIRKLIVICPAFVSDCLETLEEIAIRGKESFLAAGGTGFEMIPCLNTDPAWVETLARWVR